jgi:hypothetical protein
MGAAICTGYFFFFRTIGSSVEASIFFAVLVGLAQTAITVDTRGRLWTGWEIVFGPPVLFALGLPVVTLFCAVSSWFPGSSTFDFALCLKVAAGIAGFFSIPLVVGSLMRGLNLRFSERQMQITGLLLTLLGIATQCVPPVLDFLNIKVM